MTPRDRFPRGGHVLVAMLVSLGLAAVMLLGSIPYLRRTAGGLPPFDLRPFGYTVEEARTLLHALSEIGRTYYADVQLTLDTVYPATYALSHALMFWWLTAPGRTSDRALPLAARAALLALPFATAACDYLENAGIAAMLAAGPQVSAETVAWASFWTQAKWLLGALTETASIGLLAIAFARWWQRRQARA